MGKAGEGFSVIDFRYLSFLNIVGRKGASLWNKSILFRNSACRESENTELCVQLEKEFLGWEMSMGKWNFSNFMDKFLSKGILKFTNDCKSEINLEN